ncbi:MAG: RluA family pseudouridine synthase [Solirubrobacteraceae bacterium]
MKLTVSPGQAGTRLDRFLAGPVGSRAAAQGLIDARRVRVNGVPRPKRHLLHAGDVVEAEGVGERAPVDPEGDERPADFSVAYEDAHFLVVDKPPGVVVHPARGHQTGTLAQALAGRVAGGEAFRPGIVHRLDRDTSGLLVVAKSEEVHRALKSLLSSRRLKRQYVALVDGHPSSRTGTIDAPIGRDRRDRVRVSLDTDAPRPARTHFEIRRLLPSSALLGVTLETGRTHQIRVHMAAIGHPIAGDPLYGVAGRFGLHRQFLHAEHLGFVHPVTGEPIDVRSPLPGDLEAALERAAA